MIEKTINVSINTEKNELISSLLLEKKTIFFDIDQC